MKARLGAVGSLVVLAGLAVAHAAALSRGEDYAGWLLVLDHLFDLAAVLILFAIGVATGRMVLERMGLPLDQPLEALTFGTAVGFSILATGILGLGLAGVMYTPVVVAWIVGWGLASHRHIADLPALGSRAVAFLRREGGPSIPAALALVVFLVVAVFLIVMALAPPVDWDSLMYHLHVPAQFVQQHRIFVPPDNLQVALVSLVHMLYVPFVATGVSAGPSLLSAFMALLLGLAVFSFCARFFDGLSGSLSLALLWGTTTILLVAITARLDVTVSLYVFLAHYALLVALESKSRPFFYLAAVLLGCAVGVKYHALPYILALTPLVLWVAWSQTSNAKAAVKPVVVFAALGVAASLPWMIKNWILLGAPFYPLFADLVLEPWLVPLFGSTTVPPSVDIEVFQALDRVRIPFNLRDAFFAPQRLTVEPEGVFYGLSMALLALPLWGLFVKNKTVNWLAIPAVGYLIILIVPFPATNLRYMIPAVVPLTIAVAYMAVKTAQRFLSASSAQFVLLLLAAFVLISPIRTMQGWLLGSKALSHLVGATSAADYRLNRLTFQLIGPVIRFTNENLAEDDRILLLWEARAYYFTPTVLQDIRLTNWPLLAQQLGPQDCLEDEGVTHVLLGSGALGYYVNRGLDPQAVRWEAFQRFAQRCLTPIHESTGFVLYEIRNGR